MSRQAGYRSLSIMALILELCVALIALPARAAESPEQTKAAPSQESGKSTTMKGPMRGGMKKDGMMKEDVSKEAQKWSKKMYEQMERENMK